MSPRDRKAELARRLEENHQRHSSARQDINFDAGRRHVMLPIDSLDPNPYQPRKLFDPDEIRQLAASIAELGQHQPIVVRPAGERWQIVAGERRWRACRLLGKPTVEALVQEADDTRMAVTALAENMEREDLSDYEIGLAIRQIEDRFAEDDGGDVGDRHGLRAPFLQHCVACRRSDHDDARSWPSMSRSISSLPTPCWRSPTPS